MDVHRDHRLLPSQMLAHLTCLARARHSQAWVDTVVWDVIET